MSWLKPDFMSAVKDKFGTPQADFVAQKFNELSLPIPGKKSFMASRDVEAGLILPITRYGTIVRLVQDGAFSAPDYGRMLQSIGHDEFKGLHFLVTQGLRQVPLEMNIEPVVKEICAEGYLPFDAYNFNAGYLPRVKGVNDNDDVIVFFDPFFLDTTDGIKNYREDAIRKGVTIPSDVIKDLQLKIFKPLMQAYKDMQDGFITAEQFWQRCVNAKEDGLLVTQWDDANYGDRLSESHQERKKAAFKNAALHYERQLSDQENPHTGKPGLWSGLFKNVQQILAAPKGPDTNPVFARKPMQPVCF